MAFRGGLLVAFRWLSGGCSAGLLVTCFMVFGGSLVGFGVVVVACWRFDWWLLSFVRASSRSSACAQVCMSLSTSSLASALLFATGPSDS